LPKARRFTPASFLLLRGRQLPKKSPWQDLGIGIKMSSMHSVQPDQIAARRRVYHFGGRVQGVGFRYTVKNIALPHNVRGYVKNLPDGRVELVMEGPDPEMDQIIETVKQKMEPYIRKIDTAVYPATGEFQGFSIKH
jgi:acylphosphatase